MKKRLLSGLVLLALLQCLMLPAFAEPTDAPADPTEPSASETAADPTAAPGGNGCAGGYDGAERGRRHRAGDRCACRKRQDSRRRDG